LEGDIFDRPGSARVSDVDPLLQVSDRAGMEMHRERSAFLPHDPALFGGPRPLHALKVHRDPEKVTEADVEAVRDWLVLVNSHGYHSANFFRRAPEGHKDGQEFERPFPFDDLLSNIKDIRGWCNNNNSPHIEGPRSRSVKADWTTLPLPSLHNSLPER
jgi:hypothetical protein